MSKNYKKYGLVRLVGRSSNGDAMIDVDTLSRRVAVYPLYPSSFIKPYKGMGCGMLQCQFPKRTCTECLHKFRKGVVI